MNKLKQLWALSLFFAFFLIFVALFSNCEVGGISCEKDEDCKTHHCYQSRCVECVSDTHCRGGQFCVLQHCMDKKDIPPDFDKKRDEEGGLEKIQENKTAEKGVEHHPEVMLGERDAAPLAEKIVEELEATSPEEPFGGDQGQQPETHFAEKRPEACIDGAQRSCFEGDAKKRHQGVCKDGIQTCRNGQWGPCVGQVLPQTEACNGKDDDCDSRVDEGCDCVDGQTRSCYTGKAETRRKGICKDGRQTCTSGKWGTCLGQVLPKIELCNDLDDDCDGRKDEDFVQKGKTCVVGLGICRRTGKYLCASNGKGVICSAKAGRPQKETCNKKDDDCDGQIDEGCLCTNGETRTCYTGLSTSRRKGICKDGKQTCVNGRWGSCVGQVLPQKESCNGKDDDCDGQVDEYLMQSCYTYSTGCYKDRKTGKYRCNGICRTGIQRCSKGHWGSCYKQVPPREEVCNGLDDNCNGKTDEDFPRKGQLCLLSGKKGPCRFGVFSTCSKNGPLCMPSFKPVKEICGNGRDDDCDGEIDEGCSCHFLQRQSCYDAPSSTAKYAGCRVGRQYCSGGLFRKGHWRACQYYVYPQMEQCNQIDDNCDGRVDEGCICKNGARQPCYGGSPANRRKGICKDGIQYCKNNRWGPCIGYVKPKTEVCDKKDDNCDGKIDNIIRTHCEVSGKKGICKDGLWICSNGKKVCKQENFPKKEECNKKDDDCDGKVDEGTFGNCNGGSFHIYICKDGKLKCI